MFVMHWFKAAQPALLYLVPACLFVPLTVAKITGEFHELFNYSEEYLTQKDADDKKKAMEKNE
jgi:minor histocompatibility antigen H13